MRVPDVGVSRGRIRALYLNMRALVNLHSLLTSWRQIQVRQTCRGDTLSRFILVSSLDFRVSIAFSMPHLPHLTVERDLSSEENVVLRRLPQRLHLATTGWAFGPCVISISSAPL